MMAHTDSRSSLPLLFSIFFFFNETATTEIYTLSLHDALPIFGAHPGKAGAASPSTVLGRRTAAGSSRRRSEEHTSELQLRLHLVCRLLLEKKKNINTQNSQASIKKNKNTPKSAI